MARGFAVALAFAIVLAGCVAPEPKASAPPPPTATKTDSTGGIEGHVITDEVQPIANAQVALHGKDLQTTTDEAGAFAFSDLEPGEYTILAAALGRFSKQDVVTVAAGEITRTDIILDKIPIAAPNFTEVFEFEDTLIASDSCPNAPEGTEGGQGIIWQDYPLTINESKPDGTPLAASHLNIELQSQPDAATVDIDLYLLDSKGGSVKTSESSGPDENITLNKLLPPGEYVVRACLWLGANAHYTITMSVVYEQGENAIYLREKSKK
jgi:hypothetical protein